MKEDLVKELMVSGDDQRIVLATSALGMGVNIPSVRWVVMMGNPTSVLDMAQMMGRAGRDKRPSRATLMLLHILKLPLGGSIRSEKFLSLAKEERIATLVHSRRSRLPNKAEPVVSLNSCRKETVQPRT